MIICTRHTKPSRLPIEVGPTCNNQFENCPVTLAGNLQPWSKSNHNPHQFQSSHSTSKEVLVPCFSQKFFSRSIEILSWPTKWSSQWYTKLAVFRALSMLGVIFRARAFCALASPFCSKTSCTFHFEISENQNSESLELN